MFLIKMKFRVLLILLLGVLTSACVATNSTTSSTIDKKKATETHVTLGHEYLKKNNREASRRHFEKALSYDANSVTALHGLALLYQLTGEIELAESSFSKVIKKSPDFTQAKVSYGQFLYLQSRYDEAYEMIELATQDVSFPQRALALTYLGQIADQLGRPIKAKASYEHAVNLNPTLAQPLIELAGIYFTEKNYAKSKAFLDRFSQLSDRTAQSLWLGIRIERIFGNRDKEASYALALKNLHPYSQEYLLYKKELQNKD